MMSKKMLMPIVILILAAVAVGVFFATRGNKSSKNESGATPENATEEAVVGCVAGTSKTVVGKKYTRTGTENYSLQGKSMALCCWEFGDEQQKKKLCEDRNESPVGYSYGVLWETDKATGELNKTMERYQKDGKSCQQFYNADGTTGPESCQ